MGEDLKKLPDSALEGSSTVELKKLPPSEFCNAAAFAWACELTGPKPYINPKHDPPCYEDVEDDTKYSALEGSSTEELKKLPPSKFCNTAAFAWANQLEGPNSFQNSSRDLPCSEDVEDDTKNSALEGSSTEELKKLPDSEFCNAAAFAWACQLEGPNSFQNSSRDLPCSEDVEDILQ